MPARICRLFLISVFALVPNYAWADHCTVSKIAIIEGSWENTSAKTSYTLQSQDSSGSSCHAAQTLRFSLTSTGAGSFTTQSGGELSFYISTGSANRNFYYDGHPESYTLTANAGYGGVSDWTVSFTDTHTVGSSAESASASNSSTDYSEAWQDLAKLKGKLEVSAGRDKTGVVGAPIEFKAETNFGYAKNNFFQWNFGNGVVAYGPAVTYIYPYPGDYAVVLNVSLSEDREATARLNVKITDPLLSITLATPERIEIANGGKSEVDLFGRALVSGEKTFIFPKGTIIKAGQKISFSSKTTGLSPTAASAVEIFTPGTTEHPKIAKRIEEERAEKIASIKNRISSLQGQLEAIYARQDVSAIEPKTELAQAEEAEAVTLAAAAAEALPEANIGWWENLKRFFLRTK